MTLFAAPSARLKTPTSNQSVRRGITGPSTGRPTQATAEIMRSFEIVALRADGSLYIGQDKAPATPLLDSAFSAFARGTLIQTTQGEIAVEDLHPGDMVQTSIGEPAALVWIGSSNFVPSEVGRRTKLVRIMTDAFGPARPGSFLTVGPSARILKTPPHLRADAGEARLLSPVSAFVDGVQVIEVSPPTSVRLFHLCLTRHAVIQANGIEMETFHPGAHAPRQVSHAARDRFLGLFPRIGHVTDFGPLAHPRVPDADVH